MPDAHKNFAYSTVATAPSPATSGTSLVLATGDGANFPAAPFNVVIWPTGAQPLVATAEVARCTAKSTDTLTITRAQEGTAARTIVVGDQIMAGITAKTLTDAEAMTLVGQGEGTNATAAATTVFTQALAGLTVKDRLKVFVSLSALTQLTNIPVLYHVTDGATIAQLNNGNTLTAGQFACHEINLAVDQSDSKNIVERHTGAAASAGSPGNQFGSASLYAATADWTSSFSIGIRTGVGGVASGGTLRYRVSVYKLAGQ